MLQLRFSDTRGKALASHLSQMDLWNTRTCALYLAVWLWSGAVGPLDPLARLAFVGLFGLGVSWARHDASSVVHGTSLLIGTRIASDVRRDDGCMKVDAFGVTFEEESNHGTPPPSPQAKAVAMRHSARAPQLRPTREERDERA